VDDVTLVPDRIMEKRGFCSSGGDGSQDSTATGRQNTTNQPKPVGELDTIPP